MDEPRRDAGFDRTVRVTVAEEVSEVVGALLMDFLGPYEEVRGTSGSPEGRVTLVFYPGDSDAPMEQILDRLPPGLTSRDGVEVEFTETSRNWVDGWRDHFSPIVIGRVRVRPPWIAPELDGGRLDVVINPGLGFGTGLHPTTRGTLQLLQQSGESRDEDLARDRLVDAGTGSGILAIAAAKLGWLSVLAFDNDPVAVASATENVRENGVADRVTVREASVLEVPPDFLDRATILANMTLEPVLSLLGRLHAGPDGLSPRPRRLVVSGILAGDQEDRLVREAQKAGFVHDTRVYEGEWVSIQLLPAFITQE